MCNTNTTIWNAFLTELTGAGESPGEQECTCGDRLIMRMCQRGVNRGRCYWACANRAEACRRCFLWHDGKPNRTATETSPSAGKPEKSLVVAQPVSSGESATPSMVERMQKRGREAAFSQDMSAAAVAARELKCAMVARSGSRAATPAGSGETCKSAVVSREKN